MTSFLNCSISILGSHQPTGISDTLYYILRRQHRIYDALQTLHNNFFKFNNNSPILYGAKDLYKRRKLN